LWKRCAHSAGPILCLRHSHDMCQQMIVALRKVRTQLYSDLRLIDGRSVDASTIHENTKPELRFPVNLRALSMFIGSVTSTNRCDSVEVQPYQYYLFLIAL
jgi:hypothetical protein